MNEHLQEYVDSRGLRMQIDRAAGIIAGVKVLGLHSRNRRRYLPDALREAMPLYEGAKVNVNHAKGEPFAPRDYQDRIGVIRRVRWEPEGGIFADLLFNPKHHLAEQLAWDAEHAPENVGLSHNVRAATRLENGETLVESITAVHSVDLVADPATSRGLFEEATPEAVGLPERASMPEWSDLNLTGLREHRPDLIDELVGEKNAQLADLIEQLDRAETGIALAQRQIRIVELLEQHGLPSRPAADGIVTQRFVETLMAANSDETLRELIAERARLAREARWWHGLLPPTGARSRDQLSVGATRGAATTEEFVRAIT